ncbi:MAG: NAD-binding protein, partial [Stackebrandtia sp.]
MAFRLVEELVYRHRENVTVILPSRRRRHGPQISRVPTVRVVENDQLDADAFSAARIGTAKALALMAQDDVGNIHAALRAMEIADIQVVVRVYNTNLSKNIGQMLGGECVLLSDADMASPSFVSAALGEVAPRYHEVAGRTLFITGDPSARGNRLTWAIAGTKEGTTLLPPRSGKAALYVTAAPRKPRELMAASKHRIRRVATRLWDEMREILDRKLRFITVMLVLVIIFGTFMIWDFHGLVDGDGEVVRDGSAGGHISWLTSAYITLLTAAGGIDPDLTAPAAEKFAHTIVSFAGVLLVPVFTASIVENMVGRRLAVEAGRLRGPISDHVIVVGLGNVGTQVATQLRNLGVPVVAVEIDEKSRGVEAARNLDIPVVYGDASTMETLDGAQVRTCRALVAVTSNDIVNLEAALHAHSNRPELRT